MDLSQIPLAGFLVQWASIFWAVLRDTAPFLVLGLVLAGLLHVLVPPRLVLWALGQGGWRGAVRGALVGLPLPLCSCGVLPTALTLRRQGASLSAATSFTISTPETSVDAIAITAAMLPAAFLGVRPLAALVLAVVVGIVVEFFAANPNEELRVNVLELSRIMTIEREHGCEDPKCSETAEMCRVCGLMVLPHRAHSHGALARLRAVFQYAFGTFFEDIATWIVFGLAFAAFLQSILPEGGLKATWIVDHPNLQILFAILAGIPLYSCATASTPMAAVLLSKGLNPGAALALLLAGPATNIGNIFTLRREFGLRTTTVYYGTLLTFCWLFGVALNAAWPTFQKYPALIQVIGGPGNSILKSMPDWVEIVSSWVIVILTVQFWGRSTIHRILHGHEPHDHHSHHGHHHH